MTSKSNLIKAQAAACSLLAITALHGAQSGSGALPEAESPQSWTERESLFLGKLAAGPVEDAGFTPLASWAGEQWSNVSGGIKDGTIWDSLFTLGFEQDLSKLAKKDGLGTVGMSLFYYASSGDFGEYLDAKSDVSNIFSGDMFRVFEIYYSNSFETEYGTVSLRVGQLAADEDFMGMDYSDLFLNSSFGAIPANAGMTLSNGAGAFSQYALATLGATISYEYEGFDVILGIYNGNCGEDVSSNNGFDYSLQDAAFWYQIGYSYEIGGLAGRVAFGGNYHNGSFANYSTGGEERNFYSFYLNIQQDIIADSEGNAVLGGFVRLAYTPEDDIAEISKYIDAGINWFAPIPGRSDDVFGFGVSAAESAKGIREAEDLIRWGVSLETTYRFQLTKSMSLQPSFQVFFDTPNDAGEKTTAFVAGARFEVIF